jgi:hypothetical protein
LRERQERMTLIDRPEVVFMPGEDLSDNDDEDAPLEVVTKREILPLVDDEPKLPEITVCICLFYILYVQNFRFSQKSQRRRRSKRSRELARASLH